jgi:hypothetical protein
VCNQTKKMAWGGVENFSPLLTSHPVPEIPESLKRNIPEEPWVFEVTLNLDGKLCGVKQIGGPDDAFSRLLAETMLQRWTFTPFQFRREPLCYQTRLHFYIRERKGKPVIEVPGVTSSFSKDPLPNPGVGLFKGAHSANS